LEFQLSAIKGPDDERQICDKTADGNALVEQYVSRLKQSIDSDWAIKPYQIIITDAQMPFLNGPDAVFKIRQICSQIILCNEASPDIENQIPLPVDIDVLQK
jgi:CheY-like chemotaxis protein